MTFGKNIANQISNFRGRLSKAKTFNLRKTSLPFNPYIQSGVSYETLTQWYLYRIVKYENDKDKINTIVAINPEAVNERERDKTNLIKTIQFTAFQYL
jgi:amidase